MPAHQLEDGIDFVPTKRHILFGHHFSSIAGAAPILGPAIAVIWGWLPALLWVVFGSILMGAVQDFGSLVLSARHRGQSIGALTERIIGPRSKLLFLVIIFLLVFIVIAVFAFVIATLFVNYPGSVIPINFEILVAIFIGRWAYKRKKGLLIPSIVALLLLYAMTYVGFLYPIQWPEAYWIGGSEVLSWIVFLMLYGFIASVLPVWTLLQPRDLINSHQLIVGLVFIYLAIFIAQPAMDAPAVRTESVGMDWFPFLFITIACGAISGFHSLVASGTTSKQLNKMSDARAIGYGSMIGEATLAVAATIAVAAGFENSAAWHHHYSDVGHASSLGSKLSAFVDGTASFIYEIGITARISNEEGMTRSLAAVFISVLVISFAATSLDTAVRIQRYIIGELGQVLKVKPLQKDRYLASGLAVLLSLGLCLSDDSGTGGLALWPLFGSTNQLLGSLALLVISVWLFKKRWKYQFTLVPAILVSGITLLAAYFNLLHYWQSGNWLLVCLALLIGCCQLWVMGEAGLSFFSRSSLR